MEKTTLTYKEATKEFVQDLNVAWSAFYKKYRVKQAVSGGLQRVEEEFLETLRFEEADVFVTEEGDHRDTYVVEQYRAVITATIQGEKQRITIQNIDSSFAGENFWVAGEGVELIFEHPVEGDVYYAGKDIMETFEGPGIEGEAWSDAEDAVQEALEAFELLEKFEKKAGVLLPLKDNEESVAIEQYLNDGHVESIEKYGGGWSIVLTNGLRFEIEDGSVRFPAQ